MNKRGPMSNDTVVTIDDEISKLCIELDINPECIRHVILSNGMEMFGEIFLEEPPMIPKEGDDDDIEFKEDMVIEEVEEEMSEDDVLFTHPLRVVREAHIDGEGIARYQNYFMEFNPYSENPFCYIKKCAMVATPDKPSKEMILEYLVALESQYYPDGLMEEYPVAESIQIQPQETKKVTLKLKVTNIVLFEPYLMKRKSGKF